MSTSAALATYVLLYFLATSGLSISATSMLGSGCCIPSNCRHSICVPNQFYKRLEKPFAEADFHELIWNKCSFWWSIMVLLCFKIVAGRRSFSLREDFKIHCQAWASDLAKFCYKTSIAARQESDVSHITHTLCSHMKRTLRSDSRKVDSFSVERQHVPPTPVFTATVMEDYRRQLKEAIKAKRLVHFLPGYGLVDFGLPLKDDGTMVPIEQKALENYRRTHEFSETVIRSRRGVLAFACNVKGNFCAYYVPIATLLGAESQVEFEEYDPLSSPPSAPPDAQQSSTPLVSVSMQSPPDSLPQLLSPLEHLPPLLQLPELAPSARSVLLSQPSSEMSFSSQHVEPSFSSQQIESLTASQQVESSTASQQVESLTASQQVESSTASQQVESSTASQQIEASASPPRIQLYSLLQNIDHPSGGPSTSLQRLHSFLLSHTLRSSQSPDSAVSTQSSPISPSLRHLPVTPPPPPPSQPGSSSRFLDDNHKGKKRAQAPEPLDLSVYQAHQTFSISKSRSQSITICIECNEQHHCSNNNGFKQSCIHTNRYLQGYNDKHKAPFTI
ncbi:hypothetical protein EV360DRAFT_74500 [Lentinula raphanica]|nr:hypothetical protein EV360DRAFT_74500 [Lentinula raphanica]